MKKQREIVLGVTGSIAAYKACDLIRRLQDKDCNVSVIMTANAEAFIAPLTLASISGRAVARDLFEKNSDHWSMGHIELAKRAELLVIAPATANIIAKIAHGFADDLLSCVAMATQAPILIAPAMNTEMYWNKIFQENVVKLKKHGVHFVDPIKGKLACGDFGIGHLSEVEDIVKEALKILKR